MTEWRTIPAHPDYSVSSDGRVRRDAPGRGVYPGRLLRPFTDRRGYANVQLNNKRRSVHRLMAAAFFGPSDLLVRHLDDDRTNNVLSNLAYGTFGDNQSDAVANGRHRNASKTKCLRGHPLDEANTYVYTTSAGTVHRQCRPCQRELRHKRSVA